MEILPRRQLLPQRRAPAEGSLHLTVSEAAPALVPKPAGASLPLPPGTVDVWVAATDPPPADRLAVWLGLMSEAERRRHARFVSASAQCQHLIARVLVRTVLGRYAGVAPEAWVFAANAYGRPAIAGPATERDLRFNLTHADGLVALAVAEGRDVGIDVEPIDREVDVAALAPSVMAGAEVRALEAAAPGRARRDLFFALWTLKEAYIKARGMGLSLPLDGFAFDLSEGRTAIAFDPSRIADDPARWLFRRLAPTPRHVLAVAAEGPRLVLRPRWAEL